MSADLIKDVISPEFNKQVLEAKANLQALNDQFVDTVKGAIEVKKATGQSGTFADLAKNTNDAAKAQAALTDNTEKTRLAEIRLQQAREKAFDDYEKMLAKQQADAAKAQAKSESDAQKEIARQQKIADAAKKAADKRADDDAKASERIIKQRQKEGNEQIRLLTAYEVASKKLDAMRSEAKDIALTKGIDSSEFKNASKSVLELDGQLKDIDKKLGQSQRNVGNYLEVFQKFYGYIRIAANIIPGLGISGIFLLGFEAIKAVVDELGIFNFKLSESAEYAKAFKEAISGSEYLKAAESVSQLTVNLDLAKKGLIDKNEVVDEYNKSIGEVTGKVSSLDDVEKNLVKNAPTYIRATILKAAANIILADSAKDAAENAIKNQKLQQKIDEETLEKTKKDLKLAGSFRQDDAKYVESVNKTTRDNLQKGINENNKAFDKANATRLKQITELNKSLASINGGKSAAGGNAVTDIATLENNIANARLEQRKKSAKDILDNEKLSYDKRIAASYEFENTSAQIINNNEKLALSEKNISDKEKEYLELKYQSELADIQNEGNKTRRDLRIAQQKDILDGRKKDIDSEIAADKLIFENKNRSYTSRINAVNKFESDSLKLAKKYYDEAITDAGDVEEKKKNITKDYNKQKNDIAIQANSERQKLVEEQYNELKVELEDVFKLQKASSDDIIKIINDGSNKEIDRLQSVRDKETEILEERYKKNKIDKQRYTDELTLIDDRYNIQRLEKSLETEKAILEVLKANENSSVTTAKAFGASDADISGIISKSGVKEQISKVATATQSLNNALKKQGEDQTKLQIDARTKAINDFANGVQYVQELQDDASKIAQANYQAEIELLQQRSQLIQDQAQQEIDAENRSLDSAKTKADKIAIINAKAAEQQKIIVKEENDIKRRQAETDRALAIASIIENTAVAAVKVLGQTGLFGIPLEAVVIALGAAQLATVLATPLPKFEKGGVMEYSGIAQFGEKGREFRIDPDGEVSLTPSVTTTGFVKKGTEFINADLTTKILTRPEQIKYVGGQKIDLTKLEKLTQKLLDKPQTVVIKVPKEPMYWNTDYFRKKIN